MTDRSRFAGRAVALVVLTAVVVHAVGYNDTVVANTTYLGVLVGASVGAWIGAERAPHERRLVPRLIAVGISLTALGDVLWFVLDLTGSPTDVSIADPPWFASYVFLCAALWVMLGRSREGGPVDVDFLIDAMTIVVVSALILWSTSVSSIVTDQTLAPYVRTVWAAYPIADAVLLALVVRVLMSQSARVAQLMIAVGALFVPVTIELTNQLRGEPSQPLLLFTGTAALIALAFVRTARLINSEASTRRALEEARDAALEASRAKSMFLANMSHEIRTPLTTVLAAEEMLEDTSLDDLQVKLVTKMHRSGEMLKTLVDRILDFSRLEAGQLVLDSTTVDLHALVADVAEIYVPRAIQGDIEFEWHLDPRVPQRVVGDPGRLFQVLTNLLDNALKFTPQGKVTLLVRPTHANDEEDDAGEIVEFVVTDTGIGIPVAAQESVFESFTQVDGSTTRPYGGSGLGLAICNELILLMGGSITLQSQVGTGSTFVIRIPLGHAVAEQAPSGRGDSLTV